jgi:hypothetical protein
MLSTLDSIPSFPQLSEIKVKEEKIAEKPVEIIEPIIECEMIVEAEEVLKEPEVDILPPEEDEPKQPTLEVFDEEDLANELLELITEEFAETIVEEEVIEEVKIQKQDNNNSPKSTSNVISPPLYIPVKV